MLELISYNIAWGKKLDEAGKWIMELNPKPDILCLQEIPENKVKSFKKMLAGYEYEAQYAPGWRDHGIVYGELTAYNTKKMTLTHSKVIELGSSIIMKIFANISMSLAKHNARYTGLITVFEYKKQVFIVLNLHLFPFELNRKRRKQLGIAIEALGLLKYVNVPSLIVGDYNYSSLIGRGGLIKFMAKHGFKSGGEKKVITHRKWKIHDQVDYVFARNCKIKSITSDRIKHHSDHYPMFVKFEV